MKSSFNRLPARQAPTASKALLRHLRKLVFPWKALTIGIDGRPGAGKTELGRLLSWQLGMPLIETDLWMFRSLNPVRYRYVQLRRVIKSRHSAKRPIIIEGIKLLHMLEQIEIKCDFLIWVENSHIDPEDEEDTDLIFQLGGLRAEVEEYVLKHKPKARADCIYRAR